MREPSGETAGSMLRPDEDVRGVSSGLVEGCDALRIDASSRSMRAIAAPAIVRVTTAAAQSALCRCA